MFGGKKDSWRICCADCANAADSDRKKKFALCYVSGEPRVIAEAAFRFARYYCQNFVLAPKEADAERAAAEEESRETTKRAEEFLRKIGAIDDGEGVL